MSRTSPTLVLLLVSLILPVVEPAPEATDVTMTVVYDNYVYTDGTTADWGFGCFIEGTDETILFDTGYQGDILLDNLDTLGINLGDLDLIVISHNHLDHTGGLDSVLNRNSNVSVYFGASFPASFSQNVIDHGATAVPVDDPIEICRRVHSTGELEGSVNEQSLILDTDQGLVIVTGCSHPGIVNILNAAKQVVNKNIHLVFGGFHLLQHSVAQINQIIQEFRNLGVEKVGPSHCTGETAIALFQQEYGENFLRMGTGRTVTVSMSTVPAGDEGRNGPDVPNRFRLEQNHPNPFDDETVICYHLPTESPVELATYDASGQKLAALVSDVKAAGAHSSVWRAADIAGRNLPGGICFCRLQAGPCAQTIRMVRME